MKKEEKNKKTKKLTKKLICFIFIFIVFLDFFSIFLKAQETQTEDKEKEKINKVYSWLETQVSGKWNNLDTITHEFALLALAHKTGLKEQGLSYLKQKGYPKGNPYCFGSSAISSENQCKIKETALASLLYYELGLDTKKINEWLLNHSKLFTGLSWFIQIDIKRGLNATCNISYGDKTQTFLIGEDKKISETSSTQKKCLNVYNSYWIKIDKSCYENLYTIVCYISNEQEDYKINFLYKKNDNDAIWFVSSESITLGSGRVVDVSIKDISKCLADNNECNYEANAIAAYALMKQNIDDFNLLLPYLKINAELNQNNNSDAWLYLITNEPQYSSNILNLMQPQGYWRISNFGRYYDTAINGYALISKDTLEYNASRTKFYLLDILQKNQKNYWDCNDQGCNAIRDTAMLLWAFWYISPQILETAELVAASICEEKGGICDLWCNPSMGYVEDLMNTPSCGGNAHCCVLASNLNCADYPINGKICLSDEMCNGGTFLTTLDSPEGYCCYNGTCKASQKCSEQGGSICDVTKDEICPRGYEISASDVGKNQQCCLTSCRSCEEAGGKTCGRNEECQGELVGDCCLGECIINNYCKDIQGEKCEYGTCKGKIVKVLDTNYCCIEGKCIKRCSDEGGVICEENEKCEGSIIEASDSANCCKGECVKKGSKWWIALIILIIIGLGAGIFYAIKTGKIKLKKEKPFTFPGAIPTKPPAYPTYPLPQPLPQPMQQPQPPIKPRPLPMPSTEKPTEPQTKETKEKLEEALKKIKELTKKEKK